MRTIESRQNARVKQLRAASQRPGKEGDLIALEGEHLLVEGLRSGLQLKSIFVVAGFEPLVEGLSAAGTDVLVVSREILESATSTEAPQPIAALARLPSFSLQDLVRPQDALIVVAAGLQDPGNLGTLIRSAEAFGASGCILLPGTTSPWNAKALRASSGSAFRLPVVGCGVEEMRATLKQNNIRLLAAMAGDASQSDGLDQLAGPSAILIGNEGAGLSPELLAMADARITITYPGMTESLNAAVAGSVLLYEAARQRLLARPRA